MLANVETYRLEDRDELAWVLDSLDRLVLKPVDGSGGKGIVIGPRADEQTLAKLRKRVAGRPARAGSPSGRWRCRPRRPSSTTGSPRATSTCGRSRSTTATTCGCCRAG